MRNIKLVLAYDGSGFSGWQVQPDKRTVQQALETAIENITGTASRVAGAGRTDTGVHALGQVASFRTESQIPAERFRPALQSQLPEDVVIRESTEVTSEFHAGYDAKWKQYRYVVFQSEIPLPHLRRYATRITTPLNVTAMNQAAQSLIGRHDFRCFESHYPNKATSIRTVKHCRVFEGTHWPMWQPGLCGQSLSPLPGLFVALDIVADGFLYNMVRAIMGTLLKIGCGSWPVEAAGEILQAMDRRLAGPTAPPEGLYLMHVEYDQEFHPEVHARGVNMNGVNGCTTPAP